MKRLFASTVVTLLSSAMFFVVVCAGADMKTGPFNGSWSGKSYQPGGGGPFQPSVSCPQGAQPFLSIGKGHLNIIGAGDWVSWGCLTAGPSNPLIGTGSAIITTATGDALYLNTVITFTFTANMVGTWHQEETATGGTGRFELASSPLGPSTSDGTFDWTTQPGVWKGTNTEGYIEF
jgi:hypothetical protein